MTDHVTGASVLLFITMRHDHGRAVVVDFGFAPRETSCQSERFIDSSRNVEEDGALIVCRITNTFAFKATLGNCRKLPGLTTCQRLYFSMSVPLAATLSVWGADLSLSVAEARHLSKTRAPPIFSAGYKHCFVPQYCSLWFVFTYYYNITGSTRYWSLQLEVSPEQPAV